MITVAVIKTALRQRYEPAQYAMFWEVGDGRRADAVAMSKWRSHGHAIHGFEIKVARSDWLRELKNPAKSDPVMAFCDFWWLVAPKGVVKPEEELPIGWGFLEFNEESSSLRAKHKAPRRQPTPLNRHFASLLLRRAGDVDEAVVRQRIKDVVDPIRADIETKVAERVRQQLKNNSDYCARYHDLLKALGVSEWTGVDEVSRATTMILRSGVAGAYSNLHQLQINLDGARKRISEALEAFKIDEEKP